jgi:hypothetical protein
MAQYWEAENPKTTSNIQPKSGEKMSFCEFFFDTFLTPLFLPSPLIGKGVDLFAVKDWLGHQDIKPTME